MVGRSPMPTCVIRMGLPSLWHPLLLHRAIKTMTRDIKDLIVARDCGTSKVVAGLAEILPEGRFEVLGLGQLESRGMRKGVVVNIESTVNSIQRALEEAELMSDCKG